MFKNPILPFWVDSLRLFKTALAFAWTYCHNVNTLTKLFTIVPLKDSHDFKGSVLWIHFVISFPHAELLLENLLVWFKSMYMSSPFA